MKNFLNKKISVKTVLVIVIVAIAVAVALASSPTQIMATLSPDIRIMYNGVVQTPRDANGNALHPIAYNGRTYLPLLALHDITGIGLNWDQPTRTVSISGGAATPALPSGGGSVSVTAATQYSFSPNQTGIWQFRTSNNGSSDPLLILYDSAGTRITADDDGAGNSNAIIVTPLRSGETYTVAAGYYNDGTGSYSLAVSTVTPTALPANGGSVNVGIASAFSFVPNQTGTWEFRTSNNTDCDPDMWLYDSNYNELYYDDDGAGDLNALITANLNSGSRYYVICGLLYNEGTGSYTLNVSKK